MPQGSHLQCQKPPTLLDVGVPWGRGCVIHAVVSHINDAHPVRGHVICMCPGVRIWVSYPWVLHLGVYVLGSVCFHCSSSFHGILRSLVWDLMV